MSTTTRLGSICTSMIVFASLASCVPPAWATHIRYATYTWSRVTPSAIGEPQMAFEAGAALMSFETSIDHSPWVSAICHGAPCLTAGFSETGVARLTAFTDPRGGGTLPAAVTGLTRSYGLYLVWQGEGRWETTSAGHEILVEYQDWRASLFVDGSNDTRFSSPTPGAQGGNEALQPITATAVDDALVLTSTGTHTPELTGAHLDYGAGTGEIASGAIVSARAAFVQGVGTSFLVGLRGSVGGLDGLAAVQIGREGIDLRLTGTGEIGLPVPEPQAWLLMVVGCGLVAFARVRRNQP